MSASACDRCHRALGGGLVFAQRTSTGEVLQCLRCALLHPAMLRRSLAASAVVGSVLVALNQGDLLFSGRGSAALFWKIPLTYLVPFLVATWGALSNARRSPRL